MSKNRSQVQTNNNSQYHSKYSFDHWIPGKVNVTVFSRRGRHLEKWIWRHNVQISPKWSRSKPVVESNTYETGASIQRSRPPSWKIEMTSYSCRGAPICTKFGTAMQNDMQICKVVEFKSEVEFQYGGHLFFLNGSSYIWAINWDMSTKFGLHIDFDLLKAAISTNAKPEILFSNRGCHLDKAMWRHISAVVTNWAFKSQVSAFFVILVSPDSSLTHALYIGNTSSSRLWRITLRPIEKCDSRASAPGTGGTCFARERGWRGRGKGKGREGKEEGMWRRPESGLPRGPRWLSAGLITLIT